MPWATIEKPATVTGPPPNLDDYDAVCRHFSWAHARQMLDGLPAGGLNIAYEAVDRHARGGRGDQVALRWRSRTQRRDITYAELSRLTNRFANVLRGLGIGPGARVFTLCGRIPELYISVLGTLKNRSVAAPLFSAFGPEPVRQRLALGDAAALVTTPALYKRKVAPIRDQLPGLRHVLLIGPGLVSAPGTESFDRLLEEAPDTFTIEATNPAEVALLHFTSGTTGLPKGALHVHEAVVSHHITGRYALDLHDGDVFWCTADPGWVTGTSYGIIAPLVCGVTSVVDSEEFDAERWYGLLEAERVTVWYTAPTAIRMLMKVGAAAARDHDLSSLRFVASVGEPLNPEAVVWGVEALGMPIHDNWWQTETGGIMIANFRACDVRPGSMGRPLPGVEAAVLRRGADESVLIENGKAVLAGPGEPGMLALRPGWPSMFRGYLHEEERYRRCFAGGWYLTGDLARQDEDGYLWFLGRGDDVIKSSGHLIGPFEVESALMEHPAVVECGVIGKPDPVAGEVVKAFVSLRPDYRPTEDLRLELIGFARQRLGAAVAPREIGFDQDLPHTRSGKIVRRLLKARELGLPAGDLSSLESGR